MTKDYCNVCKFFIGSGVCYAFPNGIPKQILYGDQLHNKPIKGQAGKLVFTEGPGGITTEELKTLV